MVVNGEREGTFFYPLILVWWLCIHGKWMLYLIGYSTDSIGSADTLLVSSESESRPLNFSLTYHFKDYQSWNFFAFFFFCYLSIQWKGVDNCFDRIMGCHVICFSINSRPPIVILYLEYLGIGHFFQVIFYSLVGQSFRIAFNSLIHLMEEIIFGILIPSWSYGFDNSFTCWCKMINDWRMSCNLTSPCVRLLTSISPSNIIYLLFSLHLHGYTTVALVLFYFRI